jgi:hypothetical protein
VEFGTLVWLVMFASLAASLALFAGAFGLLDDLGKGGLYIDEPPPPPPALLGAIGRIEREEEIRQLVQARHDRQLARGEAPLDVDAEVGRLLAIDEDPVPEDERLADALREEVRQLVVARNERRLARGEPPLDVDAEIERQLESI